MNTPKHIWNAQTTNRGSAHEQGLIIDETTGDSIAVCYDPRHAPLIAAAPELLEACKRAISVYKDAIDECGGCDHKVGICCCSLIGEGDALLAAISKAEGK